MASPMFGSNLEEKLARLPAPKVADSLCCWSDLLGFGAPLSESNWEPSKEVLEAVHKRITSAQSVVYANMSPLLETALFLNDGLVRCARLDSINHIQLLSFWLRGCVQSHIGINGSEAERGLPGVRTILAHGKQLIHDHHQVTLEDFVLNYTKTGEGGTSSFTQEVRDIPVAMNPTFMQMNLAFSKAYIIESGGSRLGVSGNGFYVEEDFLRFLVAFAESLHGEQRVIRETRGDVELFALSSRTDDSRYHLGFEMHHEPIDINSKLIKTRVWKVISFFPCDEDIADFKFELE